MAKPSHFVWGYLRRRIAGGDTITSAELADLLQQHGGTGVPDDVRSLFVQRLRTAPTPKMGRPKSTDEDKRKRAAWVLSIYNTVERLRSRGVKKSEAVKEAAAEWQITTNYIQDILKNHAPAVRRRYPGLAISRAQWREWEAEDQSARKAETLAILDELPEISRRITPQLRGSLPVSNHPSAARENPERDTTAP